MALPDHLFALRSGSFFTIRFKIKECFYHQIILSFLKLVIFPKQFHPNVMMISGVEDAIRG